MGLGVKVLINTKDGNGHKVCEYGYIVKSIHSDLFEVYSEASQVSLYLSADEFTILKEQ